MSEPTIDEMHAYGALGQCPWCGAPVATSAEMGAVELGGRWLHSRCHHDLGIDLAIDELRQEIADLKSEMSGLRGSIRYEALL